MKAIRLERVADRAGHNDAREAHTMGVIDTIKSEIAHQFSDANRESTVTFLRSAGLFVTAIVFMRNFGDAMAI
ncbi:uncharacterized protein MICPUCDRAFT_58140 [Micromonas pusilla CCMP1545]|uniref:Predicted protein n=1 Tax=Micromonas pusilla (strain CCMP1545) TaxID=564608 RepID=C1MTN8_MICPC|nr:uncharacterized protein MICPUCDRAFT_58140 [Micromonas pusilla CCMP1545]EEH57348.1 predicted protein [Micromonas pusilla CCMP1545]|eukprot:XP_003058893.1 predicted protein [Micromonas pusilla CCMP1545]